MKILNEKLIKKVVTVAMVLPMATTSVFATTGTTESTFANTTVKYHVTQGYEWAIHTEIDFGQDATVNKTVEKKANEVKVTKNTIPDGKKLQITLKGNGGGTGVDNIEVNGEFAIKNGTTKLTYTVTDPDGVAGTNGSVASGDIVLEVKAGTNEGANELTYTLSTTTGTAEVAGNYTGKVVYTASIEDQTTN